METFKVVIGGCREFEDYAVFCESVDIFLSELKKRGTICILSGTCRGVDKMGERYAAERGYTVQRYPAEWGKYGRSAGPRRNREMVDDADFVIAFWDGESAGTRSLVEYTKRVGKPLRIKKI